MSSYRRSYLSGSRTPTYTDKPEFSTSSTVDASTPSSYDSAARSEFTTSLGGRRARDDNEPPTGVSSSRYLPESSREYQPSVGNAGTSEASGGNSSGNIGEGISVRSNSGRELGAIPYWLTGDQSYLVTIHTGTGYYAGTDANVYLTMYGTGINSESPEFNLSDYAYSRNLFESGSKDSFFLKMKSCGNLNKLKIRSDGKGRSPSWLLNKVTVYDEVDKKEYLFTHNQWLFRDSSYSGEVELTVDSQSVSFEVDTMTNENNIKHNTHKFKVQSRVHPLILRRGDTFQMYLSLSRQYQYPSDSFYFTLATGQRPRTSDKSLITVPEYNNFDFQKLKEEKSEWGYMIAGPTSSDKLLVEVYIPPTALPSKYELHLETNDRTAWTFDSSVYILFNPWCEDDEVYMPNPAERREYVEKQHGLVYVGTSNNPKPRDWYYAQFNGICLEVAFKLLSKRRAYQRDTAIEVCRIMSSLVNSNDDNGVLVGNWSGNYSDGNSPTHWSSSLNIMQKYLETSKSVKYGQCWVFACVLTTVMRTLGIPCRTVTNFNSAHDSQGNCSHDIYLDGDGEIIRHMSSDSIWNFHVWNDVWMKRKDLPDGYGGWQAVDATPQERSQGLFQMGPASLKAIKEGEITLPFDSSFVFAEVNADVFIMKENRKKEWEVVMRKKDQIGRKISTKALRVSDRQDITEEYKYREGSGMERSAVKKALMKVDHPMVKKTESDIKLSFISDIDGINVGEDLVIRLRISNASNKVFQVNLLMKGEVTLSDGTAKAPLDKDQSSVTLSGNNSVTVQYVVTSSQYIPYLQDHIFIQFAASASVSGDDNQIDHLVNTFDIVKPTLTLSSLPDIFKEGECHDIWVSFTNPLNVMLTNCILTCEGSITTYPISISLRDIEPKDRFQHEIPILPNRIGRSSKKSIVVSFTCRQLGGFSTTVKVRVG